MLHPKDHNVILPITMHDFGWDIVLGLTVAIPTYLTLICYELGASMSELSFYDYLLPVSTAVISYFMLDERDFEYKILFAGFFLIAMGLITLNSSIDKD
jgi:drug/metabolite transporter (DMT)-like permease